MWTSWLCSVLCWCHYNWYFFTNQAEESSSLDKYCLHYSFHLSSWILEREWEGRVYLIFISLIDHCSIDYYAVESLSEFVITVDDTRRPFVCEKCGESFPEQAELLQHMSIRGHDILRNKPGNKVSTPSLQNLAQGPWSRSFKTCDQGACRYSLWVGLRSQALIKLLYGPCGSG